MISFFTFKVIFAYFVPKYKKHFMETLKSKLLKVNSDIENTVLYKQDYLWNYDEYPCGTGYSLEYLVKHKNILEDKINHLTKI